jgi:heptosyltransferase-2
LSIKACSSQCISGTFWSELQSMARSEIRMRSVLIIKIGAIGDVAMAMPMISEIRRRAPDARISWLCGKVPAPLLALTPELDEIIEIDERKLFGPLPGRIALLLSVWRQLLGRRFDLICIGHRDRQYRLLLLTAWAKEIRTLSESRRSSIPGRHHSFEYVRMITKVDGPDAVSDIRPPHLRLPVLPPEAPSGAAKLALLMPGGAANVARVSAVRRWPLARYAEVAQRLIAQGFDVAIIGSAGDAYVREGFEGIPVLDMIGKTSLPELLALVAAADITVSHDTAVVHLANMLDAPIVALFGPTPITEFLFPRPRAAGIWGGESLACRPCYDGREFYPCPRNLCMESIAVDAVMALVDKARRGDARHVAAGD